MAATGSDCRLLEEVQHWQSRKQQHLVLQIIKVCASYIEAFMGAVDVVQILM